MSSLHEAAPASEPIFASLPGSEAILAKQGGENFSVALRVLPSQIREALVAIYGFARLVDELGDSFEGDRLAALSAVDRDLARLFDGDTATHPLLQALATPIERFGLPAEPLHDLVEANRMDQRITRYARFSDLREYCRYSADPVGRLVLAVFGVATPERLSLSDSVCTGLQLTEHWQDVAEDIRVHGRIYLPGRDLRRFGVREEDLRKERATPALRDLMLFEAARARRWLQEGQALVGSLRGHARLAVSAFAAGGHAALDALEAAEGDVLRATPRPSRPRRILHALRLLLGSGWH